MDQTAKVAIMRRHKNLFGQVIAFQNLLKAAWLAQKGKRFKNSTARFNFHLEQELWNLQDELIQHTYQPGAYYHFTIYEPKQRIISAAPYRDRVVHHALHNVLEPIFEPTFIHDSYATRKGKGTHAAIDRFQMFARKCRYVLKCDIQKYFPSIDHQIMFELLKKKIACRDTLWLIDKILDSHMVQNLQPASQPASQPARGIPIGNLTSQFFANIYLNGLDHFIKEDLRCQYYLRYMDDFVVFADNKNHLSQVRQRTIEYLGKLKLRLHEDKCRVYRTTDGVPFLGMTVFPGYRRLRRQNVVRFKRRLKRFQVLYKTGVIARQHIHQSIVSWIGHASHANTWRLRDLIFSEIVFRRKRED